MTKKVVTLVLAFLFTVPLFTVTNWIDEPASFKYGLEMIERLGPRTDVG